MKKIVISILMLFVLFNLRYYKEFPTPKTIQIDERIFTFNEPIDNVLGTIEFIKYNQINEIMLGTEDEILDKEVVGLHELSVHLDNRPNNIVLAAHNKKGLFNVITKLKIGDKVKLNSILNEYYFEVISIKKYDKNYKLPFDIKDNMMTLITCIEKNNKRLIISLKEI